VKLLKLMAVDATDLTESLVFKIIIERCLALAYPTKCRRSCVKRSTIFSRLCAITGRVQEESEDSPFSATVTGLRILWYL